MPTVNTPASGHVGPTPLPGGHQYLPYTDPHFITTLHRAIYIIDSKICGFMPCNNAFALLPGRRTFAALWADNTVWINFDPSIRAKDYGATRGRDITITAYALRMGKWTVAATLVHELAHVNGASGTTRDAEATLRNCLLKNLEDPGIIGEVAQSARSRIA